MHSCHHHGHHNHGAKSALLAMGLASVILTVPFIFYMKEISESLHAIAFKE